MSPLRFGRSFCPTLSALVGVPSRRVVAAQRMHHLMCRLVGQSPDCADLYGALPVVQVEDRRRGKAPSLHHLQPLALSLRPLLDLRGFFFGKLGTGMKDEISRQGHLPASQNG